MNRRILKKRCKYAMAVLMAEHGYSAGAFTPADGEEAVDAPCNMERRFVEHGFLQPGPLKGTPLLWGVDHMGEGDVKLASDVLTEIEYWQYMTDDDFKEMLR